LVTHTFAQPFLQTFLTQIPILFKHRSFAYLQAHDCPGDGITPHETFSMEPRLILPSNTYPSPQLEASDSHPRIPLSEAAGNSQLHALASSSNHHDAKDFHPRVDLPFSIPTVPSQPASQAHQQNVGTGLGLRRQNTRRQQATRWTSRTKERNPILDSRQYQAYRQRQTRDGNESDAKWPEELETAFLDGRYAIQLVLTVLTNI
jgi:hypothetical protein